MSKFHLNHIHRKSLWFTQKRMEDFFPLFHFLTYFLLTLWTHKDQNRLKKIEFSQFFSLLLWEIPTNY